MTTILHYLKRSQKYYNSYKRNQILQREESNCSDSAVVSNNTKLESSKSPVPPNGLEIVSVFVNERSNFNTKKQFNKNQGASAIVSRKEMMALIEMSSEDEVLENNPIMNKGTEKNNKIHGYEESKGNQIIQDRAIASKDLKPTSSKCNVSPNAVSGKDTDPRLYGIRNISNSSRTVNHTTKIDGTRADLVVLPKVPHVSPQGNYWSTNRSDHTKSDGAVASKYQESAFSKCDESSNDIFGEQSIQSVHGAKACVPNQTKINSCESSKIETKKGGFGLFNKAIVEYMERYGDISKCNDKLLLLQKWEELTKTLNARTNTNRTVEQWKRKWRYLRHHATKKKADIANGLAGGADGNSVYKLVDLARVLRIIESPVVTDWHDMEEGGVVSINTPETLEKPETEALLPQSPTYTNHHPDHSDHHQHPESPLEQLIVIDGSRESSQVDHEEERTLPVQCSLASQQIHEGPHRRRFNRRRWRPTPTCRPSERSAQAISIAKNFHTLLSNFANEHTRLRQMELEQQTQFTTLFARFVDLLEGLRNSEI